MEKIIVNYDEIVPLDLIEFNFSKYDIRRTILNNLNNQYNVEDKVAIVKCFESLFLEKLKNLKMKNYYESIYRPDFFIESLNTTQNSNRPSHSEKIRFVEHNLRLGYRFNTVRENSLYVLRENNSNHMALNDYSMFTNNLNINKKGISYFSGIKREYLHVFIGSILTSDYQNALLKFTQNGKVITFFNKDLIQDKTFCKIINKNAGLNHNELDICYLSDSDFKKIFISDKKIKFRNLKDLNSIKDLTFDFFKQEMEIEQKFKCV